MENTMEVWISQSLCMVPIESTSYTLCLQRQALDSFGCRQEWPLGRQEQKSDLPIGTSIRLQHSYPWQLRGDFYDINTADYETVLTPADFEMAIEINDYPYNKNTVDRHDSWDSEAMYNPDKFEGDIANDATLGECENSIRTKQSVQQLQPIRDSIRYAGIQQAHVQSRTDRDDYITIMWNNIVPGMQGQFEKYTTATVQTLGVEYDYPSIMHYGPTAFSRNGMPTIVPRRKAAIGQRSGFSKLDSYKINTLYECPTYGGIVGQPSTAAPPPQPVLVTLPPITTPAPLPMVTTRRAPIPSLPVLPPNPTELGTLETCRNTRPDCDALAKQGWCTRNPGWMRDYCPIACGWACGDKTLRRVEKPDQSCEDLRVDCAELAKKRYCITAQSFTKTYCARSCGFCFVAPVTEMPDKGVTSLPPLAGGPTLVTKIPLVNLPATFWPPMKPEEPKIPTEVPPPRVCRDKKHFCVAWKKAGFCQGIFVGYMKRNCPAACGWC
ncbi:astacin (Peptidase family m12A) domain-containing protein [Ditylenchus destructor]|nr:astacin (Peptidase family m12A) domain-containing protein [Ditylenchus destructor]